VSFADASMSTTRQDCTGAPTPRESFVAGLRAPLVTGNRLRDVHVGALALFLLALAVVGLSRGIPWSAAVCGGYVAIAFIGQVGRSFLLTYGRLALIAGTILFAARSAVLPGQHVLLRFGGLKVSTESLAAAAAFTFNILVICGAVILLVTLAPMKRIMLTLEQAGVTPKLTFLILSSTQSMTNLGKHVRTVSDAQESRGIEMKGSPARRVTAFFAIVSPVFLAGLNEVEERALALDARAFGSRAKHTRLVEVPRLRPVELAVAVAAILLAAASVVGAVTSWF
jgi:energy-coupling factor transport system permease protein